MPRHQAAALHVLGPLKDNPIIQPFIHADSGVAWIDFSDLFEFGVFDKLSTGEQLLVDLAAQLYNGRGIGELAASVDEVSWHRVIEGITILRGLDEGFTLLPGQWIDGKSS